MHMPCNHRYCGPCLLSFVEHFLKDESLYPLRCCQMEIPIESLLKFFADKPKLRLGFEEKRKEYAVPSRDRVYCCNPRCSTFLGSSEDVPAGLHKRREIVCHACETATCPRCKEEGHIRDSDCVINKNVEALKALARQEGWQTCPGCGTIVELHHGCNHMTCRCRTEFCYVCAIPWKGCTCPQWDEERLLITARQRVVNDIGIDAVRESVPAVLAEIVNDRARDLRVNHRDCQSHTWIYRDGANQCEHCLWHAPKFLWVSIFTAVYQKKFNPENAIFQDLSLLLRDGLSPLQDEPTVIVGIHFVSVRWICG